MKQRLAYDAKQLKTSAQAELNQQQREDRRVEVTNNHDTLRDCRNTLAALVSCYIPYILTFSITIQRIQYYT